MKKGIVLLIALAAMAITAPAQAQYFANARATVSSYEVEGSNYQYSLTWTINTSAPGYTTMSTTIPEAQSYLTTILSIASNVTYTTKFQFEGSNIPEEAEYSIIGTRWTTSGAAMGHTAYSSASVTGDSGSRSHSSTNGADSGSFGFSATGLTKILDGSDRITIIDTVDAQSIIN